jgi:transposase
MTAEIISTVERRRQWSTEDKVRIMSEALERGVTIASVADRNGVCRSLLYAWLRLAREDRLSGISRNRAPAATFVPVRIAPSKRAEPAAAVAPPEPPSTEARSPTPPPSRRSATLVEIALGNGRVIKIDASIDPVALARLVTALDGGGS